MMESEAKAYHINPFDLTKVWPYQDFPIIDIGILALNKNLNNYLSETESGGVCS
jgi:catalase